MSTMDSSRAVSSLRWAQAMAVTGLLLMLVPLVPFFRGQLDPRIYVLDDVIITPATIIIAALIGGSVAWIAGLWIYVAHRDPHKVRHSRMQRIARTAVATSAVICAIAAWCISVFAALIASLSFPATFLIAHESSPAGCRVVFAMSEGLEGNYGHVLLAPPGEMVLVETDVRWNEGEGNRFDLPSESRWDVSWEDEKAQIDLRARAGSQGFEARGAAADCVNP